MGHTVALDKDGHLVYEGLLSSKEKATIDEILDALKAEIPDVENNLKDTYGNGVMYKYNLGKFLAGLLNKFNIPIKERRRFWDEIKTFATTENRTRDEGKNSATRSFYEQCFSLSKLDKELVSKLSWRQWQEILDRVAVREDERFFDWLRCRDRKISEEEWREFLKGLHQFLRSKDTSVFSDSELFDIYDSLLRMSEFWIESYQKFKKEFPKSPKVKNRSECSKKFQHTCLQLKRELGKSLDHDIFSKAFDMTMK